MSLDPKKWGPSVWSAIHWVAAGCPETPTDEQKANYVQFYESLSKVLPCKECQEGFRAIIAANPVQADTASHLQAWTCHAHNLVNQKTGKRETWSLEKIQKEYLGVAPKRKPLSRPRLIALRKRRVRVVGIKPKASAKKKRGCGCNKKKARQKRAVRR